MVSYWYHKVLPDRKEDLVYYHTTPLPDWLTCLTALPTRGELLATGAGKSYVVVAALSLTQVVLQER
uniref:Uncharacterized protein n=1 Tax=Utricularia reniformis TaxID=192314 RepID=A0A1Y0AYS3_9LAMI|nr:hypothetical protein AEK19_MT0669 [Utricularia reniformis]ART30300.1 hypothetical protein AEK19_MT0669 [Utricularia reniformis]